MEDHLGARQGPFIIQFMLWIVREEKDFGNNAHDKWNGFIQIHFHFEFKLRKMKVQSRWMIEEKYFMEIFLSDLRS